MTKRTLPDLEQTLGNLVLELLRAPRIFPELVRSDPLDQRGDISPNAVRVTQHYITGLLAYGFAPSHEELQQAADWFAAVPFPRENHTRIDGVEMNRLEALLLLDAPEEHITPRLEQLVTQRSSDGDHFAISGRGSDFDSLWTLKILQFADARGMLNGLVDRQQLRHLAGRILMTTTRDKDLALALHLRHKLAGKLRHGQVTTLHKLLNVADRNGGMWGLDHDLRWLAQCMAEQQLTAGDYANNRDALREMILSTCYVIENLMPLVPDHPELEEPLQRAMTQWWGTFHGRNTLATLQALFPMPYDYLIILSRTLVAVRAYLDAPLIQWGAAHVHRRLAEQEMDTAEPPNTESIKQALRNWLFIGLDGAPDSLRLGISDKDIVRVKPRVWNPMLADEQMRLQIPSADTLIVKLGPLSKIQKERANFQRLPASIRPCFARVPEPSYIDAQGHAFMVLPELNRYFTLEEMLHRVPQAREAVNNEIGPFLRFMHDGQRRSTRPSSYGLLWELYLLPIQEHIGRIFAYIEDHDLLEEPTRQKQAIDLKYKLLGQMGDLVRQQLQLEGFPLAYMHGDLNTRNLMVRRLKQRERELDDSELDFKLVDLEKLRLEGDAAFDAGELLADLKLALASLQGASDRRPVEELIETIERVYHTFAEERGDTTFPIRVQLAEAHALIRVAKGRTKFGEVSLRESRRAPAIGAAFEVLDYAEKAAVHLQNVVATLNGG